MNTRHQIRFSPAVVFTAIILAGYCAPVHADDSGAGKTLACEFIGEVLCAPISIPAVRISELAY
jgi:hypothetical protein